MEGTTTIFGAIAQVWTAIMDWLAGSFPAIEALFWTGTGLTFLGTFAVISIGIGVFFLIMGVIQNFVRLRS